jgi:antitoxin HicB
MSDVIDYPFEVAELSAEDGGGFVVTFMDIPGVIGVGSSKEEAIADGRLALFACLDALKAVDRVPPPPSALRQ